MATKKEAPKVTELTKFDPIQAGLDGLAKQFTWTAEQLDKMLVHVDEKEVVMGAKKTLTATRTALSKAKTDAKKPYLDAGKVIEAKYKEIEKAIKAIEGPIDEAIARRKTKDEADAKQAQADKDAEIAELKRQLAEANGTLAEEGIAPVEFEEKTLQLSITTSEQFKALRTLIGRDAMNSLQFDAAGNSYLLSITITRTEFDKEEN